MAASAKAAWSELLSNASARYALAAMSSLREAIEQAPFADETIVALHSQLGDWSGFGLSAELFDQQKRQEVYLRAGLDRRLVDLESQAFDALLGATKLKPARPPAVNHVHASADLAEVVELGQEEEQEEIAQTCEDYRNLYQFEGHLRSFVAGILSGTVGPDWMKKRVPGDCLRAWRERAAKDREAKKQVHPILSYADLGDWPKVICRRDNWPHFEPFFCRKSFVEESFIRLIPLRNDVAHMRPLTKADRLVYYAEIQQLSVAIGL